MAKRKTKTEPVEQALNYNRVLHRSDYDEFGAKIRKDWEIAMALRTLRDFGAVHPESLILGVGAAVERTIFEPSRIVTGKRL